MRADQRHGAGVRGPAGPGPRHEDRDATSARRQGHRRFDRQSGQAVGDASRLSPAAAVLRPAHRPGAARDAAYERRRPGRAAGEEGDLRADVTVPCPFGSHRAGGRLPQSAERLDATLPIRPNELLIEVACLNLDSSSMRQIAESCAHDQDRMRTRIAEIVRARGKMHNPVTGSGGVLVGRVAEIGPDFPRGGVAVGDEICTLLSLTLTPLALRSIGAIDVKTSQITVEGHAILFASGLFTRLPNDIPRDAAMALCDVAGVPRALGKRPRTPTTAVAARRG